MKKIIVTLFSLLALSFAVSAQDMAKATEVAKIANESLTAGNQEEALKGFQEALTLAQACGEEGAELVSTCKTVIPSIVLSQAKKFANESLFDQSVEKLNEAIAVAKEYAQAEIEDEAQKLLPQILLRQGTSLMNEKNFAAAAEVYNKIIALDPSNGQAYLRLGLAKSGAGDAAAAEEAFKLAAQNGQEATANKQISNIHLKKASAALAAKNYKVALQEAETAFGFSENATAYKIAGVAATKIVDGAGKLLKKEEAIKYLSKYVELSPSAKDAEAMKQNIEAIKKL